MTRYEYHKPRTIAEAIDLMKNCEGGKYIAGGTDVMVQIRDKQFAPLALISLRNVDELHKMSKTRIGGGVTHRVLENDPYIRERLTALHEGARGLGSAQIRNVGTMGGNIMTARPAADTPPALLCLDARFCLRGALGEREVLADDFFVGPGETVARKGEILTEIIIDEPRPFTGTSYMKLARRKAVDIAIVAVAAALTLDGPGGVIKDARVVLSSVGIRVMRARAAEETLIGQKPGPELFQKAGAEAGVLCSPISDIRAEQWYRCAMVEVLTKRMLHEAALRAQGN